MCACPRHHKNLITNDLTFTLQIISIAFQLWFMALAVHTIDECGPSNEMCCYVVIAKKKNNAVLIAINVALTAIHY